MEATRNKKQAGENEHISKEVSKEAVKSKREIANKKVTESKEGKRRIIKLSRTENEISKQKG